MNAQSFPSGSTSGAALFEEVIRAACEQFHLTRSELLSPNSRNASLRHQALYLAKNRSGLDCVEIEKLTGVARSTVFASVKKFALRLAMGEIGAPAWWAPFLLDQALAPVPYHALIEQPIARRVTFKDIVDAACTHFDETRDTIFADRRTKDLIAIREEIWWFASRHTRLSLPRIGSLSGPRDHTTVLHGIRKIKRQIAEGKRQAPDWFKVGEG